MKRILYTFLLLILNVLTVFATHERAGEIVYKHISGLTYEAKIITYTYAPSPADRPELEIQWGDGTSSVLPRSLKVDLTQFIRRNEYVGQHTYAGGGYFKLSVEDPNRNYGIVNIPNSVNIPFFIETELVINPALGSNNSVILLNPPLDYGCVNRLYIHNPNAYDPDGDSISYKLAICKGANGQPIPGYQYPAASVEFSMNPITGDLVWDEPQLQGEYNVAFIVQEWRYGVLIGYVTRDLQIQISACENNPPVIETIDDTCVEAGQTLSFEIKATDPDGDKLLLSGKGSPFLQEETPAVMTPNPAIGVGMVTSQVNWVTSCANIRLNPHVLYVRARDTLHVNSQNQQYEISLSTYKSVGITIVGPAPTITEITPIGRSIKLKWDPSVCNNAKGYYIYRKKSFYGFNHGYCETGVPEYTGYKQIATIADPVTTEFTDNDNGEGLIHGIQYCYIVTTYFTDGAESYASDEWCTTLRKDLPIITNVSVDSTNTNAGTMYVAWSKPTELDTVAVPGPFEYRILRKDNSQGSQLQQMAVYYSLNDTIFIDESLNTEEVQYYYQVDLYHGPAPNQELVGSTYLAPSVYLRIVASDRKLTLEWNDNVPWINDQYIIYRQNKTTLEFDSIGLSIIPAYIDSGLVNGNSYCYKVKSVGHYSSPGMVDPIVNYSQEKCGIPVDNVPPCIPELDIATNCVELNNQLNWSMADSCAEDSVYFKIYWSPSPAYDYSLLYTTGPDVYQYTHKPGSQSVVGCYYVTALDTMHNESLPSNSICVDINECGHLWFPLVFTPNGDQANDFFRADSVNSIQMFKMKIFNRWGEIVYESNDPYFRWDGKDSKNNKDCSPGVYFYEATLSEYTLNGPLERRVTGSVTLLR